MCKFTDNSHWPQKETVITCSYSKEVSGVFTVGTATGLTSGGFETTFQNMPVICICMAPLLPEAEILLLLQLTTSTERCAACRACGISICCVNGVIAHSGYRWSDALLHHKKTTKQDSRMLVAGNIQARNMQTVFTTIPTEPIRFSTYIPPAIIWHPSTTLTFQLHQQKNKCMSLQTLPLTTPSFHTLSPT